MCVCVCVCVCVDIWLCVCNHYVPSLYLTFLLSHAHVQVPSHDHNMEPEEALKLFQQEVPALGLLGTPYYIRPDTPYTVDEEVQLVCKYLKALQVGGEEGIDRLYEEGERIDLALYCQSGKFHW